jgi:inner membrane transporter RhtA
MTAPITHAEVRPAASLINAVPPWLLVFISIISVQLGAALSKSLFETVGSMGVVSIRTIVGAAIFLIIARPRLFGHSRVAYRYIILYGITISANMLLFYAAIERIPLGISVAIAFAGPLTVSVVGSRRWIDLLWIVLAVIGILLLSPITDTTLDPLGTFLAFGCALAWGSLILVTKRAGALLPGSSMLALAMCVAAVIAAPFGAARAVGVFEQPALAGLALVVAVLSAVIPFLFEFMALKRLSSRAFGLLMSLEPAAAAILGWLILHEDLGIESIIGIALVSIAAAGTTAAETS